MMKTDLVNSCLALEDRRCYSCDSTETYVGVRRGKPHHHWYGNGNDQWLCLRCENHLIKGPRYHPLTNPRTRKKNYKTCDCGHRAKPSSGVTENYFPSLILAETAALCHLFHGTTLVRTSPFLR